MKTSTTVIVTLGIIGMIVFTALTVALWFTPFYTYETHLGEWWVTPLCFVEVLVMIICGFLAALCGQIAHDA